VLEAYAAKRWPLGKEPGGRGVDVPDRLPAEKAGSVLMFDQV